MHDFTAHILSFTCIGDTTKKKIIDACSCLPPVKQENIFRILEEGEKKKIGLEDDHRKKTLELVQRYLEEVETFRREKLRKAFKDAETADKGADEKSAEDLLKKI